MSNGRVRVGIIGSQFEGDIHAASFQLAGDGAEVVAVASPPPGNAAALAEKYNIPRVFTSVHGEEEQRPERKKPHAQHRSVRHPEPFVGSVYGHPSAAVSLLP